ncbi:hypothetical protein ACM66B_005596 [Microbotryomycetes sp. NB124-2]
MTIERAILKEILDVVWDPFAVASNRFDLECTRQVVRVLLSFFFWVFKVKAPLYPFKVCNGAGSSGAHTYGIRRHWLQRIRRRLDVEFDLDQRFQQDDQVLASSGSTLLRHPKIKALEEVLDDYTDERIVPSAVDTFWDEFEVLLTYQTPLGLSLKENFKLPRQVRGVPESAGRVVRNQCYDLGHLWQQINSLHVRAPGTFPRLSLENYKQLRRALNLTMWASLMLLKSIRQHC